MSVTLITIPFIDWLTDALYMQVLGFHCCYLLYMPILYVNLVRIIHKDFKSHEYFYHYYFIMEMQNERLHDIHRCVLDTTIYGILIFIDDDKHIQFNFPDTR